jgi:DNA mismatch repair protein MutL
VSTRILILPDEAINKIAAGEVVERPASIVKELVENSLDADADRISIELWSGGRDRIRITDNGCGMSKDDALLCLERHATSKIRCAEDLWDLRTLGFRGEALPSIVSISKTTIETRDQVSTLGTRIDIDGGVIRQVSEVGRNQGTTLDVDRIFFNTPARRKFLKGADTEWRHVSQTVTALALANPNVSFTLKHDGREALRLNAGTIENRTESLFHVRLGEDAVLVSDQSGSVKVDGYVGIPERARKSANQVIVVNGRWVSHRGIVHAVTDGYGGLLPKETSPAFALCIEVDPSEVDVNVHPSKREIKFSDAGAVYRAVADLVRSSVRKSSAIPEWSDISRVPLVIDTDVGHDDTFSSRPAQYGRPASGNSLVSDGAPLGLREPLLLNDSQIALPLSLSGGDAASTETAEVAASGTQEQLPPSRFYQIHGRFILAQVKQGMIIIDQNLAHQRVLYENAIARMEGDDRSGGQALLFPATFEFGLSEIVQVREAMPFLELIGFGIRDFGGNTVVVDAVPPGLEGWNEGELLREIVGDLISERTANLDLGDRSIDPGMHFLGVAYARRVAVPHGRTLQESEMEHLIDTLFACTEPYISPEGRPTVSRMSLDDISKRFNP